MGALGAIILGLIFAVIGEHLERKRIKKKDVDFFVIILLFVVFSLVFYSI